GRVQPKVQGRVPAIPAETFPPEPAKAPPAGPGAKHGASLNKSAAPEGRATSEDSAAPQDSAAPGKTTAPGKTAAPGEATAPGKTTAAAAGRSHIREQQKACRDYREQARG